MGYEETNHQKSMPFLLPATSLPRHNGGQSTPIVELASTLKIGDISLDTMNDFISGLISQFQDAYTVLPMTSQDCTKCSETIINLTPGFSNDPLSPQSRLKHDAVPRGSYACCVWQRHKGYGA